MLAPTTSTSSSSSGNRLLSRFKTGALASRSRTLSEYYIKPREPHRQYAPGDVVQGAVVLVVSKPVRITHLVVALRGQARVFRNGTPSTPPPTPPPTTTATTSNGDPSLQPGKGRRDGEYFGNGFVSLFQDEVVLCGEGKLDMGVYEFNFELDFPRNGLPSSLDFERGTISYFVTSTVTRPTAIAPTTSCNCKVNLVETIDVGAIQPPKPRLISLEAIPRRSRHKGESKRASVLRTKSAGSRAGLTEVSGNSGSEAASVTNSNDGIRPPRSPALSEASEDSGATDSAASVRAASLCSSDALSSPPCASTTSEQTQRSISATIQLLRGGCLRGDSIPMKVSISHTKPIKSVYGIIVTLYRQGRIDSHPVLPIGPTGKGRTAELSKHEEYYPKSKSGLGGLSLSSAGSSHTFRKDLSQTFAPLIIDPRSLTAVVKASIRVPEDCFSTISSVPGAMISFRYYVEVVVDLGGKLAGQNRLPPNVGNGDMPFSSSGTEDGSRGMLTVWGGNVIETDALRREKGVVASVFEVIIGSKDSSRTRRTEKTRSKVDVLYPPSDPQQPNTEEQNESRHDDVADEPSPYDHEFGSHDGQHRDIPPPQIPEEEEGDEKSRLRRAEERLLPSQPPPDESRTSVGAPAQYPTAPTLGHNDPAWPPWAADDPGEGPSAPPGSVTVPQYHQTDDKQELERQRLAQEASAPPTSSYDDNEPEADGIAPSLGPSDPPLPPSAPTLTEQDEAGGQLGGSHDDSHHSIVGPTSGMDVLPRYER